MLLAEELLTKSCLIPFFSRLLDLKSGSGILVAMSTFPKSKTRRLLLKIVIHNRFSQPIFFVWSLDWLIALTFVSFLARIFKVRKVSTFLSDLAQ